MPPVFAADRLSVALGGTPVLHGLTFAVVPGTWTGLLGPNGAGKTTLLRALAGLLPHRGRLLLDGRPLADWPRPERARRLAFVPQQSAEGFELSVRELVSLGRAPHRGWLASYTAADHACVARALDETGLVALAERPLGTLSGGEQQRARLAQALAQEAGALLLDEPIAHLDVHHQLDLLERTRALVARGRTVVSALHDLGLAARYCDRLLVLDRGRLVADGPPGDVLGAPLLRDVFRVEAAVAPPVGPDAGPEIRYLRPL